jgi:hypothetical protein
MDCYDLLPSFNCFWNTEICVVPDAEDLSPYYQIVLDSDDGLFGGFSRLDHEAEYFTAVSLGSISYFIVTCKHKITTHFLIPYRTGRMTTGLVLSRCTHPAEQPSFTHSQRTPNRARQRLLGKELQGCAAWHYTAAQCDQAPCCPL